MVEHTRGADRARAERRLAAEIDDLAALRVLVVAKVELQLPVVAFLVVLDHDLGGERPAGLGAETVDRADVLVAQQRLGLGHFESAAGRRLAEGKAAGFRSRDLDAAGSACRCCQRLADTGIAPVVFAHHAVAVGAGCFQRRVVAGDGIAVVLLGLLDDVRGHRGDFRHEAVAAQRTLFHLRQLVFPVASQFCLGQFFHAQATQQRHELERLRGRDQLAAFAQHVLFGDQAFDRRGAGGWRAQALFLHRFTQFVVVDGLAGAFHGAQQRGFRIARGRARLERLGVDRFGLHDLARLHQHQALAVLVVGRLFVFGFLAVDGEPARLHQHLAVGAERILLAALLDGADARRDLVLGAREKHRQEAPDHEVVELLLGFAQAAGRLQGRDDGEVIRHLGVVENPLARLDVVAVDGLLRKGREVLHAAVGQHAHGLLDDRQIVFGQGARVGTRIGQCLMPLVQALGDR